MSCLQPKTLACLHEQLGVGVLALGFGGLGHGTHVILVSHCRLAYPFGLPGFSCVQEHPLVQVRQLLSPASPPR